MIVLFIHQNFPAQYVHIATHLAQVPQNRVFFITQSAEHQLPRVMKLVYQPRQGPAPTCHAYVEPLDAAVQTGLAVAEVCRKLRDGGIVPDVMLGHAGWGETLFVKDVFPNVPLIANFEFFYHPQGSDVGFDPEFAPARPDDAARLKIRNALNHVAFEASDWGHTATAWQRSLFPEAMQRRITVLHEGVDTERLQPDSGAWLKLAREDLLLSRETQVITYVARNLEPYRGFHIFMRALPLLLRRHPGVRVLIAGADGASYGDPPAGGGSYLELLQNELAGELDLTRVHFLGHISYELYVSLLQISTVHVYWSYPFVLSWSFIEAMAAGCAIVGSATAPVLEVLKDGQNGVAVDFFDVEGLAERVHELLGNAERRAALGAAARATAVRGFDLDSRILPLWVNFIGAAIEGRFEDPGAAIGGLGRAARPQSLS